MHELDATFRKKKASAHEQRQQKFVRRLILAGLGCISLAIAASGSYWFYSQRTAVADVEGIIAEVEAVPQVAAYVPAIVDLPGDPIKIDLGSGSERSSATRQIEASPELVAIGVKGRLSVLREKIFLSSERLMVSLPSTQEDFAFFQSQRAAPAVEPPAVQDSEIPLQIDGPQTGAEPDADLENGANTAPGQSSTLVPGGGPDLAGSDPALNEIPAGDAVLPEEDLPEDSLPDAVMIDVLAPAGAEIAPAQTEQSGAEAPPVAPVTETAAEGSAAPVEDGWGDIGTANLVGSQETFTQTEIANNVSTVTLIPEALRFRRVEDIIVRVIAVSNAKTFITENGYNALDGLQAAKALLSAYQLEKLEAGTLVAMRGTRDGRDTGIKLSQIAIYTSDTFVGALAANSAGQFAVASDPWASRNLAETLDAPDANAPAKQYRLMDGIYSVALRNGVPASVAGELIMYLSRAHDLSVFAGPDDVFSMAFQTEARDPATGRGRVLYAALKRPDKTLRCFLYLAKDAKDFACFDKFDQSSAAMAAVGPSGMVTPVDGVLTSTFGPRRHPILGKVLLHKGVDWAGPTGTPIRAAFAGKVSFVGTAGGYGNFMKLDHGGGKASGYAHMSRFGDGMATGVAVKAGDIIGYVGTTGRSTGPHLHFEVYLNGEAVDPLAAAVAVAVAKDDGGAVEKLVDRIIHVESGGKANAKNPLSSATGLGQFIESTWLRMMRSYRPDLASSLARDQLLALRNDPTLSREMITNLARENKSYLERRGNAITAGRLYLAHFLGPEGAAVVLAAPDGSDLAALLGAGVINANPFLTGKNAAYVKEWAEAKMNRRAPSRKIIEAASQTVTAEAVPQTSKEFAVFRTAILALAGEGDAT